MAKRRVMIDGIRMEPAEAKRIIDEAVAAAGQAHRARSAIAMAVFLILLQLISVGSCGFSALVIRFVARGAGEFVHGLSWLLATSALTAVLAGLAYHPLMRLFHRREIRTAMQAHGFELCAGCGYWLKGLDDATTRCPECGNPLPERPGPLTEAPESDR